MKRKPSKREVLKLLVQLAKQDAKELEEMSGVPAYCYGPNTFLYLGKRYVFVDHTGEK
jgi:hypothetical protein